MVMRLSSGSAGHTGPLIKASGRILFDWMCAVVWRGLKPKLTSPLTVPLPPVVMCQHTASETCSEVLFALIKTAGV